MESYLEISFMNTCLLLYISVLVAQYATWQPISNKRTIFYAISISALSCFLWIAYAVWVVLAVELLFFMFVFRYAYKTYVFACCFRFLCMATCFVIFQGGFHNLVWFVPIHVPIWTCWIVYLLTFILLKCKWKDWLAKLSCMYPLTVYAQKKTLHLKGYLDSGNLLTYEGIPVLFVDSQYQTYFDKNCIESIVMNTISTTEVIPCYRCEIQLAGCARHAVYLHCEKPLKLPGNCKLLLNMKVMTLG